jgi:uridine phosphorylase
MYKTLTRDDWLNFLKIEADELPRALILHGEWFSTSYYQDVEALCGQSKLVAPLPTLRLARVRGETLGFGACYGSPQAATVLHPLAVLGIELVIQTGWYGALQPGMRLGDLLVGDWAFRADGTSDWYLPKGEAADATPELSAALLRACAARGISCHRGPLFSTSGIFAETVELIDAWRQAGYAGVEMETACTFAVAKHFGLRRAAILQLSDNLVESHHLFQRTPDDRAMGARRRRELLEIAIEVGLDGVRREA